MDQPANVPPPPPPPSPVNPQPITPTPTPVNPPPAAPPPPVTPPPPPPENRPIGRIVLFIVLGLLIISGVAFAVSKLVNLTPKSKTVTLNYWGLWEDQSIITPILREFETQNPNIKVNYQMQSHREYRERLQSALSQGKGPDVFRIHNTWIPMFGGSLDPIPADVYSVMEFESLFYPVAKRDLRLGANYVAVPLEIDGLAMYVNNDLFQQAHQTVPTNWDDMRDAAITLTECTNPNGEKLCRPTSTVKVAGVALGDTNNVDHWQDILSVLLMQNNVNLYQPKATTKAAQDVLDFFSGFTSSYRTWDPLLPTSTNQFINGKLAIYFAPSWRIFEIKNANPSLNFSIYPVPQVALDAQRNEQPITWASYWAEAVNKKSSSKTESWKLIKYLSSPEVLTRLYEQASATRAFGEPYSRVDMADTIATDPLVGPYLEQAPTARSWYLASYTHDGQSGLNTKMSALYVDVLQKKITLNSLSDQVAQLLSGYGITSASGSTP